MICRSCRRPIHELAGKWVHTEQPRFMRHYPQPTTRETLR